MAAVYVAFEVLVSFFTLWMLVDCIQRHTAYYWFYVILFFPVAGPLAYFIMERGVQIDLPRFSFLKPPPPTIEALRYRLEENPCLENRIALAEALSRASQWNEAQVLFQQVLKADDVHKGALHGLATCQAKSGELDAAAATLETLIERAKDYREGTPWLDLAAIRWTQNRKDDAVAILRRLVKTVPRFSHLSALAKCLHENGQTDEARKLLEKALLDYENSPPFVRKAERRWNQQAQEELTVFTRGHG